MKLLYEVLKETDQSFRNVNQKKRGFMQKYLLFLFVFIVSSFVATSVGSSGSPQVKDFLWFHPQNTTVDGLVEIADNVIKKNLLIDDKEVMCMAKNIFFEAAVESTAGKLAVAQVTLNRVNSKYYPNTVCEVVYEGPTYTASDGQQLPKRDRCQFSWYCDGKDDIPPTNSRLWDSSFSLAQYVLKNNENLPDITDGALHYHARYIKAPRWTKKKKVTATIDQHIFYKSIRR
jgi:N-acetylmuramoyl-L-alanine amidase